MSFGKVNYILHYNIGTMGVKENMNNIKIKRITKKIESQTFFKFATVGTSAAILNLALIFILVDLAGLETAVLRNVANVIAVLISTAYAFFINRRWTWNQAVVKTGGRLVWQYFLYNFITLTAITMRIILFAILDYFGVYYLLNVALGIGLVAVFNFLMYDKYVFGKEHTVGNKNI